MPQPHHRDRWVELLRNRPTVAGAQGGPSPHACRGPSRAHVAWPERTNLLHQLQHQSRSAEQSPCETAAKSQRFQPAGSTTADPNQRLICQLVRLLITAEAHQCLSQSLVAKPGRWFWWPLACSLPARVAAPPARWRAPRSACSCCSWLMYTTCPCWCTLRALCGGKAKAPRLVPRKEALRQEKALRQSKNLSQSLVAKPCRKALSQSPGFCHKVLRQGFCHKAENPRVKPHVRQD